MKHLAVRLWLVTILGGAGCAAGTIPDAVDDFGPVPARDSSTPPADPVLPEGDGADADGEVADPDAQNGDTDSGVKDAGPKDTGTKDSGKDGSVVLDAAPDSGGPVTCAFAGQLVAFDLNPLTGTTATLAASATAPGVTAAPLKRAGVTAASSSNAMNASNWPTGAVDLTKHFLFSVSPPAGCVLTVTAVAVDLKASNTGPTKAAVGTSVDGYAALQTLNVTAAGGSVNVPIAGVSGVSGPVEIHVFGYEADGAGGTLRVQTKLTVTGSLGPI